MKVKQIEQNYICYVPHFSIYNKKFNIFEKCSKYIKKTITFNKSIILKLFVIRLDFGIEKLFNIVAAFNIVDFCQQSRLE